MRNWNEITPSPYPWEREALEFVRAFFPQHEPYRAWTNFEFIADDGSINECDLLFLGAFGFYLIEIKSWPGRLDGDTHTWRLSKEGSISSMDNPRLLNTRKAKKLASLLKKEKSTRQHGVPFLNSLVFLSDPNLDCRLGGTARSGVLTRHNIETSLKSGDLPGIDKIKRRINKPTSKGIERALEAIGLRPALSSRRIGDYDLQGNAIHECPHGSHQDWVAHHRSLDNVVRRIRIYNIGPNESAENRTLRTRAAKREFQILESLHHPGLVRPEQFTESERGPALVFPFDPDAQRLDHLLEARGDELSLDDRFELFRQLAEIVQFAHGQGVVHRSLHPRNILVTERDGGFIVRIMDWQLSRQILEGGNTTTGSSLTMHPEQFVEESAILYLAPECTSSPGDAAPHMDIFSLGALAFPIFAGTEPADSVHQRDQSLRQQGGLDLHRVSEGLPSELRDVVIECTAPIVGVRLTIGDLLAGLDLLLEQITAPETDDSVVADPLRATKGDRLEGDFPVLRRLGKGATATAFLIEDEGREVVLKLANKPELNRRIEQEFQTLKRARNHLIVEPYRRIDVSGLAGFTMQLAGPRTLAQKLQQEGALQPEFLQRFGEDLLSILHGLEDLGIYHRDIKPDNIGIGEIAKKSTLRLLLFDFSLASVPLDNKIAGTLKYRDPFLASNSARTYDTYAERYTAALTLCEMATGNLPIWGDGRTEPSLTAPDTPLHFDMVMVDESMRPALSAFLEKALHRDVTERFDNAQEMARAWTDVFEAGEQPRTSPTSDAGTKAGDDQEHVTNASEFDPLIKDSVLTTQLVTLVSQARVRTAFDRLNLLTVQDLLQYPLGRFRRMRGVGTKTRSEIEELYKALKKRFPEVDVDEQAATAEPENGAPASPPDTRNIDALYREIMAFLASTQEGSKTVNIIEEFLGCNVPEGERYWPTQTEVAEHQLVTRANVQVLLKKYRKHWLGLQSLATLRSDLAELLTKAGGVKTPEALIAEILAQRGCVANEPERSQRARAVLRAAVETERMHTDHAGEKAPRFLDARPEGNAVIALSRAHVDWMLQLGALADELATYEPPFPAGRVIERLRELTPPEGVRPPDNDSDLLQLAVTAASTAALSGRSELYPIGLSARKVLGRSSGALLGDRKLTVDSIRERVSSRYPKAEALPDRPALDELLEQSGFELQWNREANAYTWPETGGLSLSMTQRGSSFSAAPRVVAPAEIQVFESHLADVRGNGGFLVLTAPLERLGKLRAALAKTYDIETDSIDRLLIEAMRDVATEKNVSWDKVRAADAAEPDSQDGRNLRRLVSTAAERVSSELTSRSAPLLLSDLGLLARYQQLGLLESLREHAAEHATWLLIPEDSSTRPTVNRQPITILSANQHQPVPSKWGH